MLNIVLYMLLEGCAQIPLVKSLEVGLLISGLYLLLFVLAFSNSFFERSHVLRAAL